MLVSSGSNSALPSILANSRNAGTPRRAFFVAGLDSANHWCKEWMRRIVSMPSGGRPVLARGKNGSITCTSAAHGATRSTSTRNSRLHVLFVSRFRPSPSGFVSKMGADADPSGNADQPGGLLSVLIRHLRLRSSQFAVRDARSDAAQRWP